MVLKDNRRALLFNPDMAITRVHRALPNHPAVVALPGCYHNLMRGWSVP